MSTFVVSEVSMLKMRGEVGIEIFLVLRRVVTIATLKGQVVIIIGNVLDEVHKVTMVGQMLPVLIQILGNEVTLAAGITGNPCCLPRGV